MNNARKIESDLANINSREAGQDAMGVLNAIQSLPPHRQVSALACSFLLLCERLDISAPDSFHYVKNMMAFARNYYPEFRAVEMYMENEL